MTNILLVGGVVKGGVLNHPDRIRETPGSAVGFIAQKRQGGRLIEPEEK
jgi:hypothetical protein